MREPTLCAVSDHVVREEINVLLYNRSCYERDRQWTLLGQFEQWTLLGQFERSAFLFIKLGGHGPEGHHVPRRVDYVQMSPDVISERLQAFENKHLFPLLNTRLRDSAEDVDTFLSFLQREVNLDIGDCLERFRSAFRR